MTYQTPGVYVEELSSLGSSVVAVDTAIPGFVGYTEIGAPSTLANAVAVEVTSMLDYEQKFGGPKGETFTLLEGVDRNVTITPTPTLSGFCLYYQMQLYFANGGGRCYVVSVGDYSAIITNTHFTDGLVALETLDDVTLLVAPEAMALATSGQREGVYMDMVTQCVTLKDRFAVVDGPDNADDIDDFRTALATTGEDGKYAAVYYPTVQTALSYAVDEAASTADPIGNGGATALIVLKNSNPALYQKSLEAIAAYPMILSPSAAIAGVYAQVDDSRGVWKAPANVALQQVVAPTIVITDEDQEGLNVDANGKSINAIRSFSGRGTLVWGARTFYSVSNDWRYVSVKRLFIMVETSVKNAMQPFVFEPNTANTWARIETQIASFLTDLWTQGAMVGTTAEEAFYVNVGLGQTMTESDIQNGTMIIEIGIAPSRPAEFIVLRFSQKLQQS